MSVKRKKKKLDIKCKRNCVIIKSLNLGGELAPFKLREQVRILRFYFPSIEIIEIDIFL